MTVRAPMRVLLAATIGWSLAARAGAQTPPIQLGVDFSGLGLYRTATQTGIYGAGVRVDVPLTRRVDVDGRLTWFPSNADAEQDQGGRTLQGGVGIRGRFIDKRHVSFYGGLWPEFLHFRNAVSGYNQGNFVLHGATHFALDMGLGAEVSLGPHWTMRGELTGPLYAVRGFEVFRSQPGPEGQVAVASLAPSFSSPWQFSAGAGYRVGTWPHADTEEPIGGRWETGVEISSATTTNALLTDIFNLGGFGGFASFRIAPGVYADGAVDLFPRDVRVHTPYSGGRLTEALAGTKLGTRKDRYGFFGKFRVGVNSHSAAVNEQAASAADPIFVRYNATALDVGGVFERYIRGHWLIRFDGGDVISVFRASQLNYHGVLLREPAPPAISSIQTTIGVGWRF